MTDTTPAPVHLAFGKNYAVPEATSAYGFRGILHQHYGLDIVGDRQDAQGPRREELVQYLNDHGVIGKVRETVNRLTAEGRLPGSSDECVDLYEDTEIKFVGSPQGSFGYLYTRAWFKTDELGEGS